MFLEKINLKWRILLSSFSVLFLITFSFLFINNFVGIFFVLLTFLSTLFIAYKAVDDFKKIGEDILITEKKPDYRIVDRGPKEIYNVTRAVNNLSDQLSKQFIIEKQQSKKLNAILDGMQEGIIVINQDNFLDYINPVAIKILGIDQEKFDIFSNPISTLNNNPELNDIIQKTFLTEKPMTSEFDLVDSGTSILASTSVLFDYINDVDNEAIFQKREIIVLLSDLTALRRLNITRREFISNASHELRTPIAAIKSSAETLQMGAISDKNFSQKFLKLIFNDAQRLEDLVTELMELTRLESGDIELNLIKISPFHIIKSSFDRFFQICLNKKIELHLDPKSENVNSLVNVDTDKFDQVLANMINNAIKWTDENGEIVLSCIEKEKSIEFKIRDNGSGIPQESLPHIFERFFKIDSSRSEPGTGLGLSISNHIIDLHGGKITVKSEENIGTEFTITLTKF